MLVERIRVLPASSPFFVSFGAFLWLSFRLRSKNRIILSPCLSAFCSPTSPAVSTCRAARDPAPANRQASAGSVPDKYQIWV